MILKPALIRGLATRIPQTFGNLQNHAQKPPNQDTKLQKSLGEHGLVFSSWGGSTYQALQPRLWISPFFFADTPEGVQKIGRFYNENASLMRRTYFFLLQKPIVGIHTIGSPRIAYIAPYTEELEHYRRPAYDIGNDIFPDPEIKVLDDFPHVAQIDIYAADRKYELETRVSVSPFGIEVSIDYKAIR